MLSDWVPATPFKKGDVSVVKLKKEYARTRRLYPGEYERILAAAEPDLRDFVLTLLETACRSGEIRQLQVKQIVAGQLEFPAPVTKPKEPRRVPITEPLQEILDRRCAVLAALPQFQKQQDFQGAYMFGNPDRTARPKKYRPTSMWEDAVLRAHGWTFTRVKGHLDAASRARYREIGLTIHDLRREAASTWEEKRVLTLRAIQEILGHANIAQTSTYLAVSTGGTSDAMRRYDDMRRATGTLPPQPVPAAAGAVARGRPAGSGRRLKLVRIGSEEV